MNDEFEEEDYVLDITNMRFPLPNFLNRFSEEDKQRLLNLENTVKKQIIGQDVAVSAVCRAIRKNQVGLGDPNRPVGSFVFLGTTGTGKTQLCKTLAEVLYGSEHKLIKFDMSEFMEHHSVSKFLGAPPGYLNSDVGGQLTNIVKNNPFAVLCFDEIEKCHPDIFNIFLQIMEDGVLTSSQGEQVSFRETIVIFTSNIGSHEITSNGKPVGFMENYDEKNDKKNRVLNALKKTFKPEFINRLDEVIVFNQLEEQHVTEICKIMLEKVRLRARLLNLQISFDKIAIAKLVELGFDKNFGARPLRRIIDVKITDMLAHKVLSGELMAGDIIRIAYKNNNFTTEKKNAAKTTKAAKAQNN